MEVLLGSRRCVEGARFRILSPTFFSSAIDPIVFPPSLRRRRRFGFSLQTLLLPSFPLESCQFSKKRHTLPSISHPPLSPKMNKQKTMKKKTFTGAASASDRLLARAEEGSAAAQALVSSALARADLRFGVLRCELRPRRGRRAEGGGRGRGLGAGERVFFKVGEAERERGRESERDERERAREREKKNRTQ